MYRKIAILAACMIVSQAAIAADGPGVSGVWMRGDGNARVRIAPCGKQLCATNLWIKDTSKGEAVGDRLIMTLKQESSNELKGEAYDPKRKLTYAMTIKVTDSGLVTRGCVVGGLICKDVRWTPAKR